MADALIETIASNPYESIVADTTGQISGLDSDIQKVSDAISNLERQNPTSPTLPRLRERLANLQSQRESLNKTNDSAKLLMDSYNKGTANLNTLQGVFDLKQAELNRAQQQADASYRQMAEDIRRTGNNYVNALGNATASENAIINANAGREGASSQSTAETRARNYLANAQAQAEAAANTQTNLNAINEGRLNSNAGYVQLSQANADNYLRQQIMNDYEAAEAEKVRQAQYGGSSRGTSSRGSSYDIFDPTVLQNNNNDNDDDEQSYGIKLGSHNVSLKKAKTDNTPITTYYNSQLADNVYGTRDSDVKHYQNQTVLGLNGGTLQDGFRGNPSANLNMSKVSDQINKINEKYGEDFNLNNSDGYITDKGYVVLIDDQNRQRVLDLKDVSKGQYYRDSEGKLTKIGDKK